jgi:hypothetical protein
VVRSALLIAVLAGCKPALELSVEVEGDAAVIAVVEHARPRLEACYGGDDTKSKLVLSVHLDAAGQPKIWFEPHDGVVTCVRDVLTALAFPPAPDAKRVVVVKIINATQRQRDKGYGR